MPIAIVSALPKPAQAPASDTAGSADSTGSGNDFSSVLLGQLLQAPGASSSVATLESLANEPSEDEKSSQSTDPSDPLALLAALSQAPADQRNDISAPRQQSGSDLPLAAKTNMPPATPAMAKLAAADSADAAPSPNQTETQLSASEQKAAKFAVSSSVAAGENVASVSSKTAELHKAGTSEAPSSALGVQAGIHAARLESAPLSVPTPVHDRDWNNDFAQKVVWLATSNKQSAELTLTPPQMGNIEVSLKIDHGTSSATATFVSSNAEVRETIEAALPRLREMLAGIGIDLGQANVSAESFRQQASGQGNSPNDPSRLMNDNAILVSDAQGSQASGRVVMGQGRGLVDLFA